MTSTSTETTPRRWPSILWRQSSFVPSLRRGGRIESEGDERWARDDRRAAAANQQPTTKTNQYHDLTVLSTEPETMYSCLSFFAHVTLHTLSSCAAGRRRRAHGGKGEGVDGQQQHQHQRAVDKDRQRAWHTSGRGSSLPLLCFSSVLNCSSTLWGAGCAERRQGGGGRGWEVDGGEVVVATCREVSQAATGV